MPTAEGKDHDELVYLEVYDITILGPEAQDRLAQVLNDLHESSKMHLAKFGQEGHLAKFARAINELIQLISDFGPAVNSPLTKETKFYSDALRKLDTAVQGDDKVFYTKLTETKDLAKKILENFLINPKPKSEPKPEPPKLKITKTKQRVIDRLVSLIPSLSHDK